MGKSSSYQNKLDEMYSQALDNLRLKAIRCGADAIVGLTIDFEEISGKGKAMFMISAIGTAVKFEYNNAITTLEQDKQRQKQLNVAVQPIINEDAHTEAIETSSKVEKIDEFTETVIELIKKGKSNDARYILMTKKGMSLSSAIKYIEELQKNIE